MENYDYNSERRPVNYLVLGFIAAQVIFIGAIIFSFFANRNSDHISAGDLGQPHISIKNFPDLPETSRTVIEYDLIELVKKQSANVDINAVAELRAGSVKTKYFERQQLNYFTAIVDIPELEQSYRIFHEYSDVENNRYISSNDGIITLCLGDKEEKLYSNFACKDTYDQKTRNALAGKYIEYFNFEYFSAYIEPNNLSTIVISPSVTYDNDDETKAKYIDEVKSAVESLGLSPDSFRYYVRTAEDVNYYN